MIFLEGPRQVGKTTISKTAANLAQHFVYLNWDFPDDQALILSGPQAVMTDHGLLAPQQPKSILVLDEIHNI